MSFSINEIKGALQFGGARQNQFYVEITNPANSVADLKTPFLVQASSIPGLSKGTIPIPYFGRTIKLAGDRVYPPWTVTVMNDEDFLIRNAMEEWSNNINSFEGNIRNLTNYKSRAQVTQLGKDGKTLRRYQFEGLWPSEVTPIDLDWGANDQIELFQVTFEYDYWTVDGITGNAGGE